MTKGSTGMIFFQKKMLLRKKFGTAKNEKKIYDAYKEAKKAKRWDPDRECHLDPKGNICIDPKSIDFKALVKSIPSEEEKIKIEAEKRAEKERLRHERYEEFLRSKDSKKVDEGIIDFKKELTAENLTKMADQVMRAKVLEVDSKSASESESSEKLSSSGSDSELGKAENAKSESVCRNCMKEFKDLTNKINILNREVIGRDKLVKSSTDRINELTEKIKTDENDVECFRKENEKLMLENRKISEDFDKLKRTVKNSDERNVKTHKENSELSGIENERIKLKLNSYTSTNFVLQHIVPKPIGKNKDGEDVYSDGTGVEYHKVPPPMRNNFTKKQSGLVNESDSSEKSDAEKLPDNIDVTFNSQSDEDSIEFEVVKDVVEKVLKSDSDSTNEDDLHLEA
ncbi:hypothetical protein Hanom_Chr02g00143651 [Helianthus anomalus]